VGNFPVYTEKLRENVGNFLGASPSSASEMPVSADGGLNAPRSLCYDESRRRLYIGERNGGRVVVVDFNVSK